MKIRYIDFGSEPHFLAPDIESWSQNIKYEKYGEKNQRYELVLVGDTGRELKSVYPLLPVVCGT